MPIYPDYMIDDHLSYAYSHKIIRFLEIAAAKITFLSFIARPTDQHTKYLQNRCLLIRGIFVKID